MAEAKHAHGAADRAAMQFSDAVQFAKQARRCRGYARTIRGGCSVYGWTLGLAEREARPAELQVRLIAEAIANATGSTAHG